MQNSNIPKFFMIRTTRIWDHLLMNLVRILVVIKQYVLSVILFVVSQHHYCAVCRNCYYIITIQWNTQFDWSIAVQDQAIPHEELKCLRGILKMSLFHSSYFIKQLQNGFPSRIAWSMNLGCCSTFGKRKNTLAASSSICTLSESLATSLVAWITQSYTENHSVFL